MISHTRTLRSLRASALLLLVASILVQMAPAWGQASQPGQKGETGKSSDSTSDTAGNTLHGADGKSQSSEGANGRPANPGTDGGATKGSTVIGVSPDDIVVDTGDGTIKQPSAATAASTTRRSTSRSSARSASSSGSSATTDSSDLPVIVLMPVEETAADQADISTPAQAPADEKPAKTAAESEASEPAADRGSPTRTLARFAGIIIVIAAGYLLIRQPKKPPARSYSRS